MFPPNWFLPFDAAFQVLTAFIALAVSLYSLHGHRWIGERTLYALFLAFLMLSIGLFINGITLTYSTLAGVTFSGNGSSSVIADIGFWAYYIMSILAYSLLVYAYADRLRGPSAVVAAAGAGMGRGWGGGIGQTLVAAGPIMELVLVILLLVVVIAQLAHLTVKRNRFSVTVTLSFVLLLISHILIMFSSLEDTIYVAGRLFELGGFITLLIMLAGLRRAG